MICWIALRAVALLAALFPHVTPATPTALPNHSDPHTPIWHGAPATRVRLEATSLGVSPDGEARFLVRGRLYDASGAQTELLKGGDVDFSADGAAVQWQTRFRFRGPAAIVSTRSERPFRVRLQFNVPSGIAPSAFTVDPRAWRLARVGAAPLGPHAVALGWFPRASAAVTVVRMEGKRARTVGVIAPPSSTYVDTTTAPGHRYTYLVREAGNRMAAPISVTVPAEVHAMSLAALHGKAMWLAFSPDELDDDWYGKWDVPRMIALARAAGLRAIELRVSYGDWNLITPEAKPAIDALIDAAAQAGIAVVAWTVPRSVAFADLAQSALSAAYRTPAGHGFAALAVDLERGEQFMGQGRHARAALADYPRMLRAALGRRAAIVATVEDPALSHLSEAQVPYAEIAANVDVLQPMVYWHAMRARSDKRSVWAMVRASIAAARSAAGRPIAINLGGQTSNLSERGVPSGAEVVQSLEAARGSGAIGAAFFDWDGTVPEQWDALASYRW